MPRSDPGLRPPAPRWLAARDQSTVAWLTVLYLAVVGGRLLWLSGAGDLVTADEPLPAPRLVVDVNAATAAELSLLPGIGPALAGRIIDARPLQHVEQLRSVRGIGPKTMERLRPLVTCPAPRESRP